MISLDFKSFLTTGTILNFSNATTEEQILEEFGTSYEIEPYGSTHRYLHFDNLRFYIDGGALEYFDCFFLNTDASYKIITANSKFTISKNMPLHKLIILLYELSIGWTISSSDSSFDYLVLKTSNGLVIYYYLINGKLERIFKDLREGTDRPVL
jgi:hypothetical protein